MVDEFSAFARMPKPVMELHDVREIVREAVFLFQVSRPDIEFELDLPEQPVTTMSDQRLLTQAVTNLVKNASEAIDTAVEADPDRAGTGHITAKVARQGGSRLHHRDRQRLRPAEGEPRTPGRALHDHAGQRHRTWTRHRAADHRAAWRQTCSSADAPKRNGKVEGASVRMELPIMGREELEKGEVRSDGAHPPMRADPRRPRRKRE